MVEITSPFMAYACDGAQTKFDITFEYQDGDPLEILLADTVSESEQTLIAGTHYVVEGSDMIGWSVRTIETYDYPYDLYIIRISDQVQESDYVENDPLPADRLEGDYDSAIKMIQELQRQIDRSLKLRSTAGTVDVEMADPVDGSVLKYMVTSGRYEAVKALSVAGITILPWMEEFLESVDYEEARIHLGGDAAWHEVGTSGEPVFENGWANSGGSYATMAFRLDSSGYIHLKGRVQGGTPDTTIFTLPVDYRPNKNQKFSAPYTTGEHNIKIESDGEVIDEEPVVSPTDHGSLAGLGDDDHLQYHTDARGDVRYAPIAEGVTNGDSHDHTGGAGAQIDHGGLAGLSDDDHTLLHNDARGDVRYLYRENVGAFTPDGDYEPATKKYVDDAAGAGGAAGAIGWLGL